MKNKIKILTTLMTVALLSSCPTNRDSSTSASSTSSSTNSSTNSDISNSTSSNSTSSNSTTNSTNNSSSSNSSKNSSSSSNSSRTSTGKPDDTYDGIYYDEIDDMLEGDSLKSALSTLTSRGFIGQNYGDLVDIYDESDVVNGKMIMFYTGTPRSFNKDALPGKTNKEHVWPQSWYGSGSGTDSKGSPGADAHNIFPCDAQLNNVRSSYAFDVLPQTAGTRVYEGGNGGSYGEKNGNLDYGTEGVLDSYNYTDKSNVFYPKAGYRGMTARILMYVATRYYLDSRYPVQLVDEAKTSAVTGSYGRIGKLSTLLRWNLEEPVSDFEIARNEVIFAKWHHNRNPFVDKPSYACSIWGNYNENTKSVCGME